MGINEHAKELPVFTYHTLPVYEDRDVILKSEVCMNAHPNPKSNWSLFYSHCNSLTVRELNYNVIGTLSSSKHLDYYFHFERWSRVSIEASSGVHPYYRMNSKLSKAVEFETNSCNEENPENNGFKKIIADADNNMIFEAAGFYHICFNSNHSSSSLIMNVREMFYDIPHREDCSSVGEDTNDYEKCCEFKYTTKSHHFCVYFSSSDNDTKHAVTELKSVKFEIHYNLVWKTLAVVCVVGSVVALAAELGYLAYKVKKRRRDIVQQ